MRSTDRAVIDALLQCRELECLEINSALDLATLERLLALPRLAILKFYGGRWDPLQPLVERLVALPATHPLRRVGIDGYTSNAQRPDPAGPLGPLVQRFPWRDRSQRG